MRTLAWRLWDAKQPHLPRPTLGSTAGIIPGRFDNQVAASKLAMCNDIGEAAYVDSLVAAKMIEMVRFLPGEPFPSPYARPHSQDISKLLVAPLPLPCKM